MLNRRFYLKTTAFYDLIAINNYKILIMLGFNITFSKVIQKSNKRNQMIPGHVFSRTLSLFTPHGEDPASGNRPPNASLGKSSRKEFGNGFNLRHTAGKGDCRAREEPLPSFSPPTLPAGGRNQNLPAQ